MGSIDETKLALGSVSMKLFIIGLVSFVFIFFYQKNMDKIMVRSSVAYMPWSEASF